MKSTRVLGGARSRVGPSGGESDPPPLTGGVCGRNRQKAARASDATPETMKVLVRADSIADPVLSVESALPSQATAPPACAIVGTLAQSIGMKMNGQLAAIQPIVPQSRTNPKSWRASFRLANAMALVTESVGT